jgi:hypothetical protein
MTRIHQQVSCVQHERWHQSGIRCQEGARRAILVFAVLGILSLGQATGRGLEQGAARGSRWRCNRRRSKNAQPSCSR